MIKYFGTLLVVRSNSYFALVQIIVNETFLTCRICDLIITRTLRLSVNFL